VAREKCVEELRKIGIKNELLDRSRYRERLANAKYVICPRGNGLDTHRFWEALYNRAIPVVIKEDALFSAGEVPCLVLDRWCDLSDYSEDDLERYYNKAWEVEYNVLNPYYWANCIWNSVR